MANTSTLADENKTENNLEKFELSRSGRKKKVRHQTNRDAGERKEMGALSSKTGRNFTNTHKMQCEATLPRTQQPKRTQYESYQYRLNAQSARAS